MPLNRFQKVQSLDITRSFLNWGNQRLAVPVRYCIPLQQKVTLIFLVPLALTMVQSAE